MSPVPTAPSPHLRLPAFLLGALAVLAITLRAFPPSSSSFYPPCPISALLHLRCPGCGSTRAVAALLAGNLPEALRLNALTTSALLLATAFALYRALRPQASLPCLSPSLRRYGLYAAFALTTLFTVARNL